MVGSEEFYKEKKDITQKKHRNQAQLNITLHDDEGEATHNNWIIEPSNKYKQKVLTFRSNVSCVKCKKSFEHYSVCNIFWVGVQSVKNYIILSDIIIKSVQKFA